jgi:predicted transcriptional regulator
MHTLTLKVPELLHTRLNRYAKQKGLSKSEIVRLALQNYFSQEAGVRGASIYDLAQDLAGSVEAPADLSANKANLEGYGA